jgi:hypothetical protein
MSGLTFVQLCSHGMTEQHSILTGVRVAGPPHRVGGKRCRALIEISAVVKAGRSCGFGKATVDNETAKPIELGSMLDRSEGRTRRRDVGVGIHQFADSQSCGIDGL